MISNDHDALRQRLDAIQARLQGIDDMDATMLRRSADECRRLARQCQQQRTVDAEALAERFEAVAVDIAMELDERTVAALLSGHALE